MVRFVGVSQGTIRDAHNLDETQERWNIRRKKEVAFPQNETDWRNDFREYAFVSYIANYTTQNNARFSHNDIYVTSNY
jgi:hypothetical protein